METVFKLIKIHLCETKMSIMRVGSRTPATSKIIDNCDSCYRMEAVKIVLKSSILDIAVVLDPV